MTPESTGACFEINIAMALAVCDDGDDLRGCVEGVSAYHRPYCPDNLSKCLP